ncbi:MAG: DNA topoisomerase VI subunit B [Crenarchaeota archaeon]|nr:DNA topoisomerase VI subunit B [Thermoproteota archaeon]
MPQRAAVKETFKSMSPSRFFYEYKELAGFSNPARALYQTVRELVENALDATDVHGIKPDIVVVIRRFGEARDKYTVAVLDNGIGIDPKHVPYAFAQVLYSSKYKLRQSRGRFGLGVKMAVLYAQMTTGEPVEVYTSPLGSKRIYYFKLKIDIEKNKPIVLGKGSWSKTNDWHGTLVKITIRGDWQRAGWRIKEYIKRTAIVTPYARIVLITPDGSIAIYPRVIEKVPPGPKEAKPHPHGVDIEMLKYLIKNSKAKTLREFLIESFQGVGRKTADKFLKEAGFDPNLDPHKLNDKMLEKLAAKLKEYKGFRSPSASALSPLGEEVIEAGLKAIFSPEFVTVVTRKPKAYEGHPFIVEVGIAYGGEIPPSSEPILLRYANKIPLLYDEKSDVAWKVVDPNNFDWKQYLVTFPAPLVVLTHICSTKIPYKGVGKESIADVSEIEHELKNAVREAARKLRAYILEKKREQETRRRLITFLKYMPEITRSLAVIAGDGKVSEEQLKEKLVECIVRKLGVPKEHVVKMISSYEVKIEE